MPYGRHPPYTPHVAQDREPIPVRAAARAGVGTDIPWPDDRPLPTNVFDAPLTQAEFSRVREGEWKMLAMLEEERRIEALDKARRDDPVGRGRDQVVSSTSVKRPRWVGPDRVRRARWGQL